jgi:hypothetical protein
MGALAGEVAGGFRRAAERCGTVLNDIVLTLFLALLSSPIFLFAVFIFACHGRVALRWDRMRRGNAVADRPMYLGYDPESGMASGGVLSRMRALDLSVFGL